MTMFTIIGSDNKPYGPVSAEQLLQWLADGRIHHQTLVQSSGSTDWQPLGLMAKTHGLAIPPPLPPVIRTAISSVRMQDDAGMRLLMPVGRSIWAIAAGYLGLFSLLAVPAPFALAAGVMAIIDIRKSRANGSPKYGMGRAIFGLVMGAVFTVLLIVGIVAINFG
jgi:hypothetical protein